MNVKKKLLIITVLAVFLSGCGAMEKHRISKHSHGDIYLSEILEEMIAKENNNYEETIPIKEETFNYSYREIIIEEPRYKWDY